MKKILLLALVIIALAFTLVSCSPASSTNTSASLVVNRSTISMTVGDTYTLKTGITPAQYKDLEVSWTNSDESVVKCEGGKLTALSVGSAVIKASIETGDSFTCRVEVKESLGNLYLLKGQSIEVNKESFKGYFDTASYVSTNAEAVSVTDGEDKLVLRGLSAGSSFIKLTSGEDSIEYCKAVVLPDDSYGISVTLPELPLSVTYEREGFSTEVEVFDITVEKDARAEYLAGGFVRVTVTFKYKKVSDTAGADATNPVCFDFELYSEQTEGMIKGYRVLKGSLSASDGEELEYTYVFDAMLDTGDGRRDFTFVIPEISR